jgi:predicted regulator of Ras-like GTPase activity (Roadblock/LC7/MglB family)
MSKPAAAPVIPVAAEDALQLPLKAIVEKFPTELKGKVARPPGATDLVTVSRKAVLAQLASGSVKVTFAELRQGSPAGLFSEGGDLEHVQVEIPLTEILTRVDPSMLPRRTGQKKFHVPDDVVGLFGAQTAKAVVASVSTKPEEPSPASVPVPAAAAPLQMSEQLKSMMTSAAAPSAAPKPSAPGITPLAKTTAPAKSAAPLPGMASVTPVSKPVAPLPGLAPVVSAPKPIAPIPAGTSQPATLTPTVSAVPAVPGMITVQVGAISENWPELIKHEITQFNMADAMLQIPAEEVGRGLKFGKVAFTWQQLLAWAQPQPTGTTSQPTVTVDLPLKVVAPLFLAQHQPGKAQRKLAVAESIPELFTGKSPTGPAAVVATAAAAPTTVTPPEISQEPPAPALAPLPVAASVAVSVTSASLAKTPSCLGDLFGQPGQANYELNEVVQKSTLLPGVGGAIMTLNDGWLVAAELPPGLSSDNVAGFVSQVFGRANQFAKDLGTGELTNMQFTTGKIPWLVCNAGDVFFAVMGRADEPLPFAQVEFIAGELRKQNKK